MTGVCSQDLNHCLEIFQRLDADGSGFIDIKDLDAPLPPQLSEEALDEAAVEAMTTESGGGMRHSIGTRQHAGAALKKRARPPFGKEAGGAEGHVCTARAGVGTSPQVN